MRIFKIRKRANKYRTIYAPNKEELAELNLLVKPLRDAAALINVFNVQHGFQPGRSAVTNALEHRGWRYTLSFDLQDFFESVTPDKFTGTALTDPKFAICFPDGAARQGLPTSPMLANIAADPMDRLILQLIKDSQPSRKRKLALADGVKQGCVYTRYADDLTFSFDSIVWFEVLKTSVPNIAEACGFKINPEKTYTQAAKAGRRMITGVAVDSAIHIPRHIKRRLRAAKHQRHSAEARGLAEWCKLKAPKGWVASKPKPVKPVLTPSTVTVTVKPKPITTAQVTIAPVRKRIIRLDEA